MFPAMKVEIRKLCHFCFLPLDFFSFKKYTIPILKLQVLHFPRAEKYDGHARDARVEGAKHHHRMQAEKSILISQP